MREKRKTDELQRQFQGRRKLLEAEEARQKELFEAEEKAKQDAAKKFAVERAKKCIVYNKKLRL